MERYRADSGLVEGEVGWRKEGEGRGGEGEARGGEREGRGGGTVVVITIYYYSTIVDL